MKPLPVIVLLLLGSLTQANACSVCFNGSETPLGGALTLSIFVLLGFLAVVFACFGWFIYQQVQRSKESPYDYLEPRS